MAYYLSRAAASDVARYLSTYHNHDDHSSEVASALYALVNADETEILLEPGEDDCQPANPEA